MIVTYATPLVSLPIIFTETYRNVMKDQAKVPYKMNEAFKFCKHIYSVFKSEERRRVC